MRNKASKEIALATTQEPNSGRVMGDHGVSQLVAQMRTTEIRSVIQTFVAAEGRFERRNVTEYLRRFDVAIKSLRLVDIDIASQFELTVHEDYDEQVHELTAGKSWKRAKEALREAFRRFDETRVTVERFVAWIDGAKDRDDPDDILRGFERRFGYLDATERTYFAEKTVWLLRALPIGIRREAAKALRDGDSLTDDWTRVSETIRNLSRVTRVVRKVEETPRPSPSESDHDPAPSKDATATTATVKRRTEVSDLCDRLERLSLNFIAAIERLQPSAAMPPMQPPSQRRWEPAPMPGGLPGRQARVCMWCDREGHLRRDCSELRQSLDRGDARLDDRGLVCRSDMRPFPVVRPGTGGMKAILLEEQARQTATVGRNSAIRLGGPEARVRVQTVMVDEKRARAVDSEGAASKRPRQGTQAIVEVQDRRANKDKPPPGFWEPTTTTGGNARRPALASVESSPEGGESLPTTTEKEKMTKPAYTLQTPVRKKDPEQLAVDAVLGATATVDVATLLNVVPISTLRAINQQLRTKRVAVQATRLEEEDTGKTSEAASERPGFDFDAFQLPEPNAVSVEEGPSIGHVRAARVPGPEPPSEIARGTWAWSCPQVDVFIPSLGRAVRALIDSGSEITVADAKLAAEASWLYDPRPNWQMCTAHGKSYLRGACPNVRLDVGDLSTEVNLFIQDDLGYPLILGQTWLMAARLGMQCQPDGTGVAWISSADGTKVRCWVALGKRDEKGPGRPEIVGSRRGLVDDDDEESRQDFRLQRSA